MKKNTRIIALLLVCVLIVGMSVSFVSAAELRYYSYGTVSVPIANLREEPALDAKISRNLEKGDRVRILEGVTNDGITWYRVRVATGDSANMIGYVATGCITLD